MEQTNMSHEAIAILSWGRIRITTIGLNILVAPWSVNHGSMVCGSLQENLTLV
uniref:Uncharacterized protein n=1 Tax=Helianthus annuus TaxID=4232 RepID=A0A251S1T7_HELAN